SAERRSHRRLGILRPAHDRGSPPPFLQLPNDEHTRRKSKARWRSRAIRSRLAPLGIVSIQIEIPRLLPKLRIRLRLLQQLIELAIEHAPLVLLRLEGLPENLIAP